jgi:hypothetical protein
LDEAMNNEEVKSGIRKVNISTLNLRTRGSGKAKPRPSLFDNPQDRTYWTDDDKGILLEIALTRNEIRRSLKLGYMLDIKNSHTAAHLNKNHILDLMKYQMDLMLDVAAENESNIFHDQNTGEVVMIDYSEETNRFEFVFVK